MPAILAGDFNLIPSAADMDKPERWADDALFRADVRQAYGQLLGQGWTDALRAQRSSC